MRENAREIAESEISQERTEKRRRESLTPTQRRNEDKAIAKMQTEQLEQDRVETETKQQSALNFRYGKKVAALVCPHCQSKGTVRRTAATRVTKSRVNSVAARAIGLGTNSEKSVRQLFCESCEMTWDVA